MRIINQEFSRKEVMFQTLTDGQVFLIPRGSGRDTYMKLENETFNDEGSYNCVLLNNGELYYFEPEQMVYIQDATLVIKHKLDEI